MAEQTEWVEREGLRFHCVLDRTAPEAPWIAFSNSIVTDFTIWDAQAAPLSGRFNILRYDQRGHGRTSVPPGPASIEQLGEDLIALLDHFGIGKTTLVGLSMGVPTVLHVAGRRPDLVERLVLSDGQSATASGGAETWKQRIALAEQQGMRGYAEETARRWFTPESRAEGRHRAMQEVAARIPLGGFVACATALQGYDYRHVLAEISVPTLILAGEADGNMPKSMQVMRDAIPGARMAVIFGAGHVPCAEQPAAFNEHLLAFLGVA